MKNVSLEAAKVLHKLGYDDYTFSAYELETGICDVLTTECTMQEVPEGFVGAPYVENTLWWLSEKQGVDFSINPIIDENDLVIGYENPRLYYKGVEYVAKGTYRTVTDVISGLVEYALKNILS